MLSNRRMWMVKTAQALGVGGLVAGIAWGRHAKAKSEYERELTARTLPILNGKSQDELHRLPALACEGIRDFLHSACISVGPFVDRVCSPGFNEQLRVASGDTERDVILTLEFERMVIRETEILGRLDVIAREIGQELDTTWAVCCRRIEQSWSEVSLPASEGFVPHELTDRVEPTVRRYLREAHHAVGVAGQRPSMGEALDSIGTTLIDLIPMTQLSGARPILIPVFLIAALSQVWRYIASRALDSTPAIKESVSGHLALLGNRAGSEFEVEVRRLISRLQQWQEASILAEVERRTKQQFSSPWG